LSEGRADRFDHVFGAWLRDEDRRTIEPSRFREESHRQNVMASDRTDRENATGATPLGLANQCLGPAYLVASVERVREVVVLYPKLDA
jgi:hypothetical protein